MPEGSAAEVLVALVLSRGGRRGQWLVREESATHDDEGVR